MSRYAVKITKEELFDKIFSALKMHEDFDQEEWDESMEWTREYNPGISDFEFNLHKLSSFSCVLDLNPNLIKDLSKVSFSTENFECFLDKDGDTFGYKLGGLQTLDNGFTFLGCAAGGDWEQPVFFIIYWDGSKLRGYIPTEGNVWNKKYKTAYGSEQEREDFEEENDSDDFPSADDAAIEADIKKRIIIK